MFILFLLFINTIKCHRNFGKKLKLYCKYLVYFIGSYNLSNINFTNFLVKFNPILDEAYNYYSDDDKNEKSPKKLKEYWNSFKSFFLDFVIGEKKIIE